MNNGEALLTGCTPLSAQGGCALWRVDLDAVPDPRVDALSPFEQRRAKRFAFERDRRRYMTARTVLRHLLAQRLGLPAVSLELKEGPQGKPFLPDAPCCQFNVSHSGSVGLIGIDCAGGSGREIGIDVEIYHREPNLQEIAENILTPQELRQLQTLPRGQRCKALLHAWTRKEACVKAIGTGLNIPPSTFDTGFSGDRQICISDDITTNVLWLQTLAAGNDVIASLAYLTRDTTNNAADNQ